MAAIAFIAEILGKVFTMQILIGVIMTFLILFIFAGLVI